MLALTMLAERHRDLGRQITTLTARIDPLVTTLNPALRAALGSVPMSPPSCRSPPGTTPTGWSASLLRRPLRCRPGPGVLRQDPPLPAVPGRGPASQPCRAHHRAGADVSRPHHPRLHISPARPRPVQQEILRILKRAICRDLPSPHPSLPGAPMGRPTTSPPSQRHHPHRRGQPLRRLARHHLHSRNANPNATTNSPPPTEPGWRPHNPTGSAPRPSSRSAGAVKTQRPTGTNDLDRAEHRHTITNGGTPLQP